MRECRHSLISILGECHAWQCMHSFPSTQVCSVRAIVYTRHIPRVRTRNRGQTGSRELQVKTEMLNTHLRQPHSPVKSAKTSYVAPIISISMVAHWLHEFGHVCPLSLGSVPTQDLGFWDLVTLHHSVLTFGQ